VDHAAIVGEGHGLAHPFQDVEVAIEREVGDALRPRLALDPLHGVEQGAVIAAAEVVDRHDAGVVEGAGDHGLGDEAVLGVLVGGLVLPDQLDRDLAIEAVLPGRVDHPHAAGSDGFEQVVVARTSGIAGEVARRQVFGDPGRRATPADPAGGADGGVGVEDLEPAIEIASPGSGGVDHGRGLAQRGELGATVRAGPVRRADEFVFTAMAADGAHGPPSMGSALRRARQRRARSGRRCRRHSWPHG